MVDMLDVKKLLMIFYCMFIIVYNISWQSKRKHRIYSGAPVCYWSNRYTHSKHFAFLLNLLFVYLILNNNDCLIDNYNCVTMQFNSTMSSCVLIIWMCAWVLTSVFLVMLVSICCVCLIVCVRMSVCMCVGVYIRMNENICTGRNIT